MKYYLLLFINSKQYLKKERGRGKMQNKNTAIKDCSKVKAIIKQKGIKAKILIYECIRPKGGYIDENSTLWKAGELNDKSQCIPTLVAELNKLPDLA